MTTLVQRIKDHATLTAAVDLGRMCQCLATVGGNLSNAVHTAEDRFKCAPRVSGDGRFKEILAACSTGCSWPIPDVG